MNGDTVVEPPETNDLVTFPDPEIGMIYFFEIIGTYIQKD